jgi:hypothetical protein
MTSRGSSAEMIRDAAAEISKYRERLVGCLRDDDQVTLDIGKPVFLRRGSRSKTGADNKLADDNRRPGPWRRICQDACRDGAAKVHAAARNPQAVTLGHVVALKLDVTSDEDAVAAAHPLIRLSYDDDIACRILLGSHPTANQRAPCDNNNLHNC